MRGDARAADVCDVGGMSAAEYPGQESGPPRTATETFLKIVRAVVWVFYVIVVINAIILSLAFVLRLLGASPEAGFVEWVYRSASRIMAPFRGMFPETPVGDASVLDTSLLFAAITYIVLALIIDGVARWLGHKLATQQAQTEREWAAAQAEARWQRQAAAQGMAPGQVAPGHGGAGSGAAGSGGAGSGPAGSGAGSARHVGPAGVAGAPARVHLEGGAARWTRLPLPPCGCGTGSSSRWPGCWPGRSSGRSRWRGRRRPAGG